MNEQKKELCIRLYEVIKDASDIISKLEDVTPSPENIALSSFGAHDIIATLVQERSGIVLGDMVMMPVSSLFTFLASGMTLLGGIKDVMSDEDSKEFSRLVGNLYVPDGELASTLLDIFTDEEATDFLRHLQEQGE